MEKYFPYGVITASCLINLIPHVANFSPIYSAVNYGFVTIKNSYLATISILAMLYISSVGLNLLYNKDEEIYPLYGWWLLYVFPTHIINGFISKGIIKKPDQYIHIGVTCLITSVNFFVLSNFGYFIFQANDHSIESLQKTYLDAIPFFPMQVLAFFAFAVINFGLHTLLFRRSEVQPEDLKAEAENKSANNTTEGLLNNNTTDI